MSPSEAIMAGGASGLGVVGLFTLFGRHLFSRWLKNIDDLPEKLEENKRDIHRSFEQFKREINDTLEANSRDMAKDLGAIRGDNDRAIEDTRGKYDKEIDKLREAAHDHRERTGADLGRVSNRVDNIERVQSDMKQDVRALESRLHRVDLNVVAVAVKLGIEPVMPARENGDRG